MNPKSSSAPQVEVSISCRDLVNRDTFSKSDPVCILYTKMMIHEKFYEYGRTETIQDNLSPNFVKKFMMEYHFEESQHLRFELYDIDADTKNLGEQDFLGRMDCTLGGVLAAPGGKLDKPLTDTILYYTSSCSGHVILLGPAYVTILCPSAPEVNVWLVSHMVWAGKLVESLELVTLQFRCKNVDRKDLLGKSDPFLVISRSNNDSTYTVVHKTEVVKNTLNATWEPFSIRSTALCNGQDDREIKLECYDWDMDGGHDFIGDCTSSLRQLRKRPGIENNYPLMNAKKTKKRGYKNSGMLCLVKFHVERDHSFLDYIQGGLEMNFTVAIDFTVSNGNPNEPSSLHFRDPAEPNLYARALKSVGEIIQDYDTDKMFPALGFGAKVPPDQKISHEFFLNLHPTNPFCEGVDGILEAYYRAIDRVELYGPTNFSPVIKHVGKFAQRFQDGSHYFVLLILTDGVITDMDLTKAAVIAASSLPISIIIVGIGDADFTSMDVLDSDENKLKNADGSRVAERDIVQFVPFREFIDRHGNLNVSEVFLAKEVLAEVPEQVLSFMKKKKIKPNPRKPTNRKSLTPKTTTPVSSSPGGFGETRSPSRPLDSQRGPSQHTRDHEDKRSHPQSSSRYDQSSDQHQDGRSSQRHHDRYADRERPTHPGRDNHSKGNDPRDDTSRHPSRNEGSRQKHRSDEYGGRSPHGDSGKRQDRHHERGDQGQPHHDDGQNREMTLRELERIDTLPDHFYEDSNQSSSSSRSNQRETDDGHSRRRNHRDDREREEDPARKSDRRRHRDDEKKHRSDRDHRRYDDDNSDEDNDLSPDEGHRQRNKQQERRDRDEYRSSSSRKEHKSSDSSSRGQDRRQRERDERRKTEGRDGMKHSSSSHQELASPEEEYHKRSSRHSSSRSDHGSESSSDPRDRNRRDHKSSRSRNSGESRSRHHENYD